MGAWGLESCSNDDCWDNLYCRNIHKPTNKEMENSLTKVKAKYENDPDCRTTYLGVIVWGLTHNAKVSPAYLSDGIEIAKELLKNQAYLRGWRANPEEMTREDNLKSELVIMEDALAHRGKCSKPQEAPEGLISKIAKRLT